MSVTTTPLTATIGAEIAGMKGRELVDPWVAVECLALLDRYGVLVYREANVSDAELVDFSRLLGDVVSNPPASTSTEKSPPSPWIPRPSLPNSVAAQRTNGHKKHAAGQSRTRATNAAYGLTAPSSRCERGAQFGGTRRAS